MNTSASTPNTEAEWADNDVLDIAVGILRDARGRVLIAQRRPGTMGAGYWEFPGGKHEPGEAMETTLARELEEELGIVPLRPQPLVRMRNPEAMRPVRLHVWLVTDWQGTPYGCEGQRIQWCPESDLSAWQLLPGNRALLNALGLPARFVMTPDDRALGAAAWQDNVDGMLASGNDLMCLWAPSLDDGDYATLAERAAAGARDAGLPLLLDRSAELVYALDAAGLYLSVDDAIDFGRRPVTRDHWFGLSARHADDLMAAGRLDADFAVLS